MLFIIIYYELISYNNFLLLKIIFLFDLIMAEVAEEYRSSLSELNFNSKPHINMLTMLADENIKHAPLIVETIVQHLNSVPPEMKLPSLYLLDSIVKNVGKIYVVLFTKHLVALFTSVFEKVDETVRSLLYKLRSTWSGIFPNKVLLQLDKTVVCMDPAWPILAQPTHMNIHVNPKFLDGASTTSEAPQREEISKTPQSLLHEADEIKKKQLEVLKVLQAKKQQLIELKRKASSSAFPSEFIVEKPLNLNDPRIKRSLNIIPDAAPLQSVVVVPKSSTESTEKTEKLSNDRDKRSLSPESKKPKLSTVNTNVKKSKPNNVPDTSQIKSSVQLHHNNNIKNSHVLEKQITLVNSENKAKHKKRALSPDSSHFGSKENKKVPISAPETSRNSSESVYKSVNISNDVPSQANYMKGDIQNHFLPDKNLNILDKDSKCDYNQIPLKPANIMYSDANRLHSPPSVPLLFGNEDKDYRTILHNEVKSDEKVFNEKSFVKRPPASVVKSFKLDKKERKVYFVNDRCFAVMDDNIPRELFFEGPPKLVFIEGLPQPIELGFGGQVAKFDMDGKLHTIKFGSPSREIYINNHSYEAQFGGPPILVTLDNDKVHRIRISGPPPQVILGKEPAFELYETFCQTNQEFLSRYESQSNINHADKVIPPARDVDMRMINDRVSSTYFNFPVEKVNDVDWQRMPLGDSQVNVWDAPKNSFETFKDVKPNFISTRTFPEGVSEWSNRPLPPPDFSTLTLKPPPMPQSQLINSLPGLLPTPKTTFVNTSTVTSMPVQQFPTSDSMHSVPKSIISYPPPNLLSQCSEYPPTTQFNKVLQFTNAPRLVPPPLPPFMNPVSSCNALLPLPPASQRLPLLSAPHVSSTVLPPPIQVTAPSSTLPTMSSTVPSGPVNVDLFLEKLVAAGIIGKKSSTPPLDSAKESEKVEEEEDFVTEEPIPEIIFDSKCLKEYHRGVINALHTGSQCATCGMRFKEIQSEQYSRHLDWHFRMNRREKDGAKKPLSRRLFYEVKDWIEFKEIEEIDERAPSYFELQANDDQTEESIPEKICSVPSTECDTEICAVCSEQFQLFWVEEEEEWHLKHAVMHDEQVYHPACYEDFKKARESAKAELDMSTCSKEEDEEETADNPDMEIADIEEKEVTPDEVTPEVKEEPQEPEPCATIEEESTNIDPSVKVEESQKTESPVVIEHSQNTEPSIVLELSQNTEPSIVIEHSQNTESSIVKEEPMETTPSEEEKSTHSQPKSETVTENNTEKSEPAVGEISKSEETTTESSASSPSEKVPEKPKEEEEEEEIEFRPPTPDPRFQVLDPVFRTTEVSALCTIM